MKPAFNELIHAPNRLQICALLLDLKEIEFSVIKQHLQVSDSVLSKHIKSLEDAHYVSVTKRANGAGGRQRTWVALSASGRQAFVAHVAALRAIVGEA